MRRRSGRWLRRLVMFAVLITFLEVIHKILTLDRLVKISQQQEQQNYHQVDVNNIKAAWSPDQLSIIIQNQSRDKGRKNGDSNNNHETMKGNDGITTGIDSKVTSKNMTTTTMSINEKVPTQTNDVERIKLGEEADITSDNQNFHMTKDYVDDICRDLPGNGPEGRMGFQALKRVKIFNNENAKKDPKVKSLDITLLCIVITDSTKHTTVLSTIMSTYGPECDGFLAASNHTDPSYHAIDLLSVNNSSSSSPSSSSSSQPKFRWEQILNIWSYVDRRYKDQFSAFHLYHDDTYLIPQNLKQLIKTFTKNDVTNDTALYLGGAIVPSRKQPEIRYCGGGAGYTLNKKTLDMITSKRFRDECHQPISQSTKQQQQQQQQHLPVDQQMSYCLEKIFNIKCMKTTDQNFGLRFLEFGIDYHARWNKKYQGPIKAKPLAQYHGIYLRQGVQGFATDAVAFHLVNGTESLSGYTIQDIMQRVHVILTDQCEDTWKVPIDALDADGNPGYVHDPTYLRTHPLQFTYHPTEDSHGVCDLEFGTGHEGKTGYEGLKKIRIMSPPPPSPTEGSNKNKIGTKVLCMVYTHSERHTRIRSIAETYGSRCDGFLAASNLTDQSIGAVNILHEGPEQYDNMWLKVRSIWQYVYKHYVNEYDFFHLGGDDHYVIPENLRYMAIAGTWKGKFNHTKPLFLGGNMIDFPHSTIRYCGGGSGYTLNRIALRLLVQDLLDTSTSCRPHFQSSQEDRMISNCFRSVGIDCIDTNDEKNETRYHQSSVEFHSTWTKDVPSVWRASSLEEIHGIVSKERLGQISESSISFHLKGKRNGVLDRGIRRYHAILYNLC